MAKSYRGGKYVYVRNDGSTKWDTEPGKGTPRSLTEKQYGTPHEMKEDVIKDYVFSGQTVRGNNVEAIHIPAHSYEEALRKAKLRGYNIGSSSMRESKEFKKRNKKG